SVDAKSAMLMVSASPGGTVQSTLDGTGSAQIALTHTGGGTVTSTPSGIDCTADCSATFPTTPVKLAAPAHGTHTFAGWSGSGCGGTGDCMVALTSAVNDVTATFTCNNGLTNCSGACVDLLTDAANCGMCGHSCGAQTCVGGLCALASGQDMPLG